MANKIEWPSLSWEPDLLCLGSRYWFWAYRDYRSLRLNCFGLTLKIPWWRYKRNALPEALRLDDEREPDDRD